MNRQTVQLLEHHFDTAFAAPNGIKKLRELILALAMQGKLVDQDPQDQPASELLKEIEAEKRRLVKAGKIKTIETFPEIKPEDQATSLPHGWTWVRLGEIAIKIGSGSTPRGGKNAYVPSGIPFFRSQNIWNDGLRLDDVAFISNETHKKMLGTKVAAMDILLNITGASLGRCALVPDDFEDANVSQHVTIIRPVNQNFRRYIHLLFLSPYCQKMIWTRQVGMAREGLSKKVLEQFEIPLPPLAEQHRIVAKINQLMARCDELEKLRAEREQKRLTVHTAALNRLLMATKGDDFSTAWRFISQHFGELYSVKENVAELRKAILQLAVRGKLVPQNPQDQPASQLLQEIEAEKKRMVKAGKIKAPKPLPEIKEMPYELPKGWEWVRFEEIVEITSGVTKGRKLTGKKVISLPYLRVANVQRGYLALEKIKHIEIAEDEIEKFQLKPGDLLITEGGDWDKVGRTAIWGAEIQPCIHQNHIFKARCLLTTQNAQWMEKYLNSTVARDYFADASKQTTNLASINKTQLRGCPIPMPPLAEQQRIVAKIDQLMAHCVELDKQIAAATGKQTALLNAVMAQV